ncbi:MAG: NAD(P)H-dependent oxidoreductase subunit E [Candidatus Diapherotrites archaeon]
MEKRQENAILLNELRRIHKREKSLPRKELEKLARKFCMPESVIFSTATFYSFLSTEKKAKHSILVSNCPTGNLKGSQEILKYLEKKLGIREGHTTKDKKIYLGTTSCIGLCDKAPAILVDGKPVTKVNIAKVEKILRSLK